MTPTLNAINQSESSYFQIFCTVQKGSDPLFFLWSINQNNIKSSPDVHYKIDNFKRFSTLTIDKLKRDDSGNYGCIVSNQFGSDSQNILLTVKGKKIIIIFVDFVH